VKPELTVQPHVPPSVRLPVRVPALASVRVRATGRALRTGRTAVKASPAIAPIELITARSGSKTEISEATKCEIK
jgi:hypothetical protein